MTTEELEELLEGAEETDVLEFKGAMAWDIAVVKDILAMANIRDGGRIVIGIEDASFTRQGLSEDQLKSYDPDILKDLVGRYADPFVTFTVNKVADTDGRFYVVIVVAPFSLTPVICKKNGGKNNELQGGAVYYRSQTRRPSSDRISNATDMRDVLDRAAVLRMRNFQSLGLQAVPTDTYDYDQELGGL